MRLLALAAVAAALLISSRVRAAPPARLVYSRGVGAESCPDEPTLRHAVASRVGYDAFFPWAQRTIVANLGRRGPAFVAAVTLVDEKGVAHGIRELRAENECGELLDAVALAIAIAIDPQLLAPAAKVPAPSVQPAAVVSLPSVASDAPTPTQAPDVTLLAPPEIAPRVSLEGSVGLAVTSGVAPGPAGGLGLGVAVRRSGLSIALEGRIDAPSGMTASTGGRVTSWLVLGALVPCAYVGPALFCGIAQAGSTQSSSDGVPGARSASVAWWAAGARVGVLVPLGSALVRVRSDLVANLSRTTLQLGGVDVWTAPPVAASLGADVIVRFR